MKITVDKLALAGLQWSLAVVIVTEAAFLAFAPSQIAAFGRTGIHSFVRVALAWSEILSAILFLVPRARIVGGRGLLVVFLFAAGIHVRHGQWNIGALVIYSAAVLVTMSGAVDQA